MKMTTEDNMTDPVADGIAAAAFVFSIFALATSKGSERRSRQPDIRVLCLSGRPLGEYELSAFGASTPVEKFDTVVRVQNFGPGTVKDVGFCIVTREHTVCSVPPFAHVLSGTLGVREEFRFMPFFGDARAYATGDAIYAVVFATDEFGAIRVWSNVPNLHTRIAKYRFRKRDHFTAQGAFHMLHPEVAIDPATTSHVSAETRPRPIV